MLAVRQNVKKAELTAKKHLEMVAKLTAVNHNVSSVKPFGQCFDVDEANLGARLWHSEMRDPRVNQGAFLHNTVGRSSRPTRLDRKTSHTLTDTEQGTDHVRTAPHKTVRFFAFDIYWTRPTHRGTRDLDERIQ